MEPIGQCPVCKEWEVGLEAWTGPLSRYEKRTCPKDHSWYRILVRPANTNKWRAIEEGIIDKDE